MPAGFLLLKTNSSQILHKVMAQCSGGIFPCSPPIYYCDSMSCRDQRGCSPQGCLIQEAGSFPQHTPSSLPTTFTFHCRDAVWNNNNTCTMSHSIIGAVIPDLRHILSLPWGWHDFHSKMFLKCQFGPALNWEDPDKNLYLKQHRFGVCVGKGQMMQIRCIYHSAMGFVSVQTFHF